MSKKISGAEYQLAKIFSSNFEYVIPSYQRPYAWTVDQASELFDDLYAFYSTEPEEGYFLGSIVLIKKEDGPYSEVIDGQQRITTLTILLSCLASKMVGEQRDTLSKYIREPGNEFEGLEPKPRLTLRERDKQFFADYVQTLNFTELFALDDKALANESRVNIKKNSQLLMQRIEKYLAEEKDLKGFIQFLLQRCFLVTVSTPSQQSAFRVFSVMNSRGLDLQPTDIIKADVIGLIQSDEKRQEYNDSWEEMEVELGRGGFNDLFNYVRMIFAKEKAKRALLEEFRHHVLSKHSDPVDLIDNILTPYADALATVRHINYEAVSHAEEVNGSLRWLKRIDNSDWIPSAIQFLSQQKNNPEYVAWFFQRLERLAAFMHVCAYNINDRIDRYSKLLNALESEHDKNNLVQAVELSEEEKSKFKEALNGPIYALTARRRNYVILRLDSFMSDGAATYDPNILTIEHVLPQTVHENTEWEQWWPDEEQRQLWVHRIANLVPLNQRRNSKAKNYDFKTKKEAYFGGKKGVSSYILTTQVLNQEEWRPEYLAERQQDLLDVFCEYWRLEV